MENFIFLIIVTGFILLVINIVIFIMFVTALYRFNKYFPILAESNNKIAVRLKKLINEKNDTDIEE